MIPVSFPTCRGAIHCALFDHGPGPGRDESRPYIAVFLALLLTAACSGEKGPCKQCLEDMTLPAVQFSCDLWLKQQGKKDGDPGRAAAYDECLKKGLDAALKNDNNIKEARERCEQTGRCKK